jgi:hypothetical protein
MNGNENKNDRKFQSSWLYAKKVKKKSFQQPAAIK